MGPLANREVGTAREARLELVVAHGELPPGIPLHLKLDTGMGRFGLAELPLPPVEVVGLMSHLATADSDVDFVDAAARALPRRDEALPAAPAPHREQRGRAADPRDAPRRRPLRHRPLRPLPVRTGSRPRRARAGAPLGEPARPGEAPPAGREHRLRPPLRRRASRRGSASSPSATRTASAATSPARPSSSTASAARSVGTVSMDSFAVAPRPRAPARDARDDRRRRAPARGARPPRAGRSPTSSHAASAPPANANRARRVVVDS